MWKDSGPLGCNTFQSGRQVPVFQKDLLPPTSGQIYEKKKKKKVTSQFVMLCCTEHSNKVRYRKDNAQKYMKFLSCNN